MKKIASRKDSRVIDLLIAYGAAGYGVYVMLVEYLGERKSRRSRGEVARIAYELHAEAEMVRAVLEDFGLFDCTETEYYNLGKAPKPKGEKETEREPVEELADIPEDSQSEDPTAPSPAPGMNRSQRRRLLRKRQKELRKISSMQSGMM